MMNLRALDPAFTLKGKVGMQSGGKLEQDVWGDYEGRRAALAADAEEIRFAVNTADEKAVLTLPAAEPYEGEEGGVIMRLHKRYERDPKLVRRKREAALAEGRLVCEVCGFDFEAVYGGLGAGYIEVHHTKPVHTLTAGTKTKLADLALLCANCHRMAHRKRFPLSLSVLKAGCRTCG
jgi:5-methylcytosine-specific restriction protein A